MKLWILRPVGYDTDDEHVNWRCWYDKCFGVVVRAETEEEARAIASKSHGDEGRKAWLDASMSTCLSLESEGLPGVIICDVHSA